MSTRPTYFWRLYFLIFVLLLGMGGLVWRIFYLGIINRPFLEQQSAARSSRVVDMPAHRGVITDRNGIPLAVSTNVASIWVSPSLYDASPEQESQLAKLLSIDGKSLRMKIDHADETDRDFVYLKRHLSPEQADKIKALDIAGVFAREEYQRYYPEGEVMAQVLGFTDIDDHGAEGLELSYDAWLNGVPGKKQVLKDRLGHIVSEVKILSEPQAGHDLVLSIDRNIQYLAYKQLQDVVNKYHAESGSALVLDVNTGEILAMVNQPSYNPNARPDKINPGFRNRAVTDLFEPGSTLKTFSIASALESGKYKPETKIDTNPGILFIDGNKINDEGINHGVISVTEVLKKSSNIGVAKITLSLAPDRLLTLLRRFGFGDSTNSGFPGEAVGHLPDHLRWRPFVLATLAFGYSISVTPLQLACAYAVLGEHGILKPVTFLKLDKAPEGKQIIAPKIANQMLQMLETVLQFGGSGTRAQVTGYHVAGKTGTAKIAGAHGYKEERYTATFVGIAPVSAPRLVVAVVVKNPQGAHLGGLVAAPVFSNIMAGALRILNVMPDDLKTDSDSKKGVEAEQQTVND
jgi:cell division protein FtsI (penicillin-binding protein 3)